MLTPISWKFVHVLVGISCLIAQLYGFHGPACALSFFQVLSFYFSEDEKPLWYRILIFYCVPAAWIFAGLAHIYLEDGTECRRLDEIFTNRGYNRMAKLNRKIDYWRTPSHERKAVLLFFEIWAKLTTDIQDAQLDRSKNPRDDGKEALEDILEDIPRLHRQSLEAWFHDYIQFILSAPDFPTWVFGSQATERLYRQMSEASNPISQAYGSLKGSYTRVQPREARLLIEMSIETMDKNSVEVIERIHEFLSGLRVWGRAWVRPFRQDFEHRLKMYYEKLDVSESGACDKGINGVPVAA